LFCKVIFNNYYKHSQIFSLYAIDKQSNEGMAIKVLFEINHIRLIQLEDGVLYLEVDDYELNDFLEDYLWDNFHIESEYVAHPSSSDNRSWYSKNVVAKNLIKALSQLDLSEIERIYKLNN
jgi:hypothetical protein